MTDDRTHGDCSAINEDEPLGQDEEAVHAQFSKLADLARKATEDHIARFVQGSIAPALDRFNLNYAVLCGVVSASVTCLVGASDLEGYDADTQATSLAAMGNQMAAVFNQIQDRKALLAQTEGGTRQ